MSTRGTSIAVYHEIVEQGLVRGIQKDILQRLAHCDVPMTMREIADQMGIQQANAVNPRAAELERRGAIRPAGKRRCLISGRTAMTWEITGNLPTAINQNPTDPVTWKGRALAAEKEVMRLRQKYGELPFRA